VFLAASSCDANATERCCRLGQAWNGTRCLECETGYYGVWSAGGIATCASCPNGCMISGLTAVPASCSGITGCADPATDVALCDCAANQYKDNATDTCVSCPQGQQKAAGDTRPAASLDAATLWGGMLNTCEVVAQETSVPLNVTVIWAPVVSLLGAILLCYGARKVQRRARKALKAQAKYEEELDEQVDNAMHQIGNLGFSMCFVAFEDLQRMGSLWSHEKARDAGYLKMLDTFDELLDFVKSHPTVFCSHQWLGLDYPDPASVHYPALLGAVETLCSQEQLDKQKLYCWVDYFSIPQSNRNVKANAISSIGIFASVCRYFVAVAPTAQHVDTGLECNIESYLQRGWCRLEQWARLVVGGLERVYLFDGERLIELGTKPEYYQVSIKVFDGQFTDPRDKQKLVPTILGLWATVLRNQRVNNDTVDSYGLVCQNYSDVFPSKYFGDLLPRLEAKVEDEDFNLTARSSATSETSLSSATPSADVPEPDRKRKFIRHRVSSSSADHNKLFQSFRAGQGYTIRRGTQTLPVCRDSKPLFLANVPAPVQQAELAA